MKLRVETYSRSVSYEEDGSGQWDSRREWLDSGVSGVKLADPKDKYAFQVPDDSQFVFVVYVLYQTGGTFATTYGEISIANVLSDLNQAFRLKERIEKNEATDKEIHAGYKVWDGYFERLESVNIEVLEAPKLR